MRDSSLGRGRVSGVRQHQKGRSAPTRQNNNNKVITSNSKKKSRERVWLATASSSFLIIINFHLSFLYS